MLLQTPPDFLVLRSHVYSVLRRFLIYEGNYLHIRNSYTFKALLEFSSFLSTLVGFALPDSLQFSDLRLWETGDSYPVRSPYVFNLKSLLHTILVGWKLCTLHFQTQIGISRSSLSNRKNSFFSDDICTHVMPDVDVRICFTFILFRTLLVVNVYVFAYVLRTGSVNLKSL